PPPYSGRLGLSGNKNGFFPSDPSVSPRFGTSQTLATNTPFQSVGSASHYLAANSNFRAVGTTTVGTPVTSLLKTRSTQPPISFPVGMQISGELALFPQAPRYVSGAIDLGYWYEAL